jgi:hypothetical protein
MLLCDEPSGDHGRKNEQKWPAIRTRNVRKLQGPLAYRYRAHAEQDERGNHQYPRRMAGHVARRKPFEPNGAPLLVSLDHSHSVPRALNVLKWWIADMRCGASALRDRTFGRACLSS